MKLRIRDWSKNFENNRTRELKKLEWVPVPNRMDGDGYTELLDHPDGAAHFGAWIAIVQIASKCEERGTLLRDGAIPHDIRSLARMSRIAPTVFEAAIPRLLKIRWLESVEDDLVENQELVTIPQDDVTIPQEGAVSRARVEGNGREWNGREGKGSSEPRSIEPAALAMPSDLHLQKASNATQRNPDPTIDPCTRFKAIWRGGPWFEDTWRAFGLYVNTPERLAAFERNAPLWMKTRKYAEGFGWDSVKFLKSGVWLDPPGPELMPDHARAPAESPPRTGGRFSRRFAELIAQGAYEPDDEDPGVHNKTA